MSCTPKSLATFRRSAVRPKADRSTVDVAVVGGGAVGTATAWLLARQGARVVLLEERGSRAVRRAARGTAWSAHPSWIPPGSGRLLSAATELWCSLEAETGVALCRHTDAVDHGETTRLEAVAAQDSAADQEWLRPEAAAARWPGTAFTGPVLYRRRAAIQIHADQAIAALTAAATGQGVLLRYRTPVLGVDVHDASRVEIRTPAGRWRARCAVLTGPPPKDPSKDPSKNSKDTAPSGPSGRAEGEELHFAVRSGFDGPQGAARWPLIAHQHAELGLVRAVPCPRGHLAVGRHGERAVVSSRMLQDYVRDWYPGLEADRPEPVARAARSTVVAPVSIDRSGPVLSARSASVGSILATALGQTLAEAAAADVPVVA